MKRFLLLITLFIGILFLKSPAQITITTEDLPTVGLQVISAVDNTTQINPGTPGLNQVWDFTNLVPASYDTTLYLNPQGLPNYQNYPEAEVAVKHLNGNPLPYWDYEYCRYDGQGMRYTGDEDWITIFGEYTMTISIGCNPDPLDLKLPFHYGDNYNQQSTYVWYLSSHNAGVLMDSIKQISQMDITTTGDASGIVSTPYGAYPALRVINEIVSQDSVFNWTDGAWVLDRVEVNNYSNYRWYTNDYYEVGHFTIDEKKGNSMKYFKSETIVGVQNLTVAQQIKIYPNPANGLVYIECGTVPDRIEVLDITGSVKLISGPSSAIDISNLSMGMYIVRVHTDKGVISKKLIKK